MAASLSFYFFALCVVVCALRVISAKNPVHAVLFLVLVFVASSCLWIMLGAEFLALTLIVVYVGAVMVLFLFVVMMLDIDIEALRKGFWRYFPLALLLGVVVLVEMVGVIVYRPMVALPHRDLVASLNNGANANWLGWLLYTQYAYLVELASLILLLGLVTAVALTLRQRRKLSKYQNVAAQVAVDSKVGRIEIIRDGVK